MHDDEPMIRAAQISVVTAALCTIVACSRLQEPGTDPGDSTPLFVGFKSYSTLGEITRRLPDRSGWEIISDAKTPARLVFRADGRATVSPHTDVWQWAREPRFVGWADQRFDAQATAWVEACS
jgi:hypothetical protein